MREQKIGWTIVKHVVLAKGSVFKKTSFFLKTNLTFTNANLCVLSAKMHQAGLAPDWEHLTLHH